MSGKLRGLTNTDENEELNEIDEEQEKSTIGKKLSYLRAKFTLGTHHTVERFMVLLGITMSFMLLFTSLSFAGYRADVANLASSQAKFADSFTFSLSNQTVNIEEVYGNKERTDVMVLLRMNDPKAMSTDAKNYQMFVTGQRKPLKVEPEMTFSVFGTTGYAMIRFQSQEPLRSDVVSVTLRANADISEQTGSGTSGIKNDPDTSFKEFDQGKLYVNPGAHNVKPLKGVKANETDPAKLYVALVANKQDKEIHKEIATVTKDLGTQLNKASEYSNRLTTAGYKPPTTPWFVEGDYVDDDGVLQTGNNLSYAHVFDYYTKDIHDGYINQVMSDVSEFTSYMTEHTGNPENDEKIPEGRRNEQVKSVEVLEGVTGGELVLSEVSTDSSSSSDVAARDAANTLTDTWSRYGTLKSKLQRDLMRQLLILDADVQSQTTVYSENTTEDAVLFY